MRATAAWLIMAGALAVAAPQAMGGTVDQQQSQSDAAQEFHGDPGGQVAQTFTAGRAGLLDRVEMILANYPGASVELSLHRAGSGGSPGDELAVETIEWRDLSSGPEWVAAEFDPPLYVTQGHRYAIVARTTSGYRWPWFWYHGLGDPYPAGDAWSFSEGLSGGWVRAPGIDRTFRTYVDGQPDCAVVRAVVNDRLVCV